MSKPIDNIMDLFNKIHHEMKRHKFYTRDEAEWIINMCNATKSGMEKMLSRMPVKVEGTELIKRDNPEDEI